MPLTPLREKSTPTRQVALPVFALLVSTIRRPAALRRIDVLERFTIALQSRSSLGL
jgi:hypothetical protein